MTTTASLSRLKRLAGVASVLVVAACAQTAAIQRPAEVTPVSGDPYDMAAADQVLWRGFGNIVERFIDKAPMSVVAVEGFKGLSAIDPELSFIVNAEDQTLILVYQEKNVVRFNLPADDDAKGWADVGAAVLAMARGISAPLRDTDQEGLYKAVFDATLASLDVFSRYASAAEAQENRATRNGFGGVGIRYDLESGALLVTEVFGGTPASDAGLTAGDRVTHIDDVYLKGLSEHDIRQKLRGPIDSEVKLTVLSARDGSSNDVSVKRALVIPSTVSLAVDDKGVATISVSSFNQQTAAAVAQAIDDAKARKGAGLLGVVLDLRGNPGGLLDQAVAVSDLFLPRGGIVHTRGRHPDASQHYEATEGDPGEDLPVVVLVDGHSASAAEIVAAALQDNGRAAVVGSTSFGKGSVQTVVRLPNDGEMTLTWSRFHSPSGYALQDLGVLPSVCTSGTDRKDARNAVEPLLHSLRSSVSLTTVAANMARWRAVPVDDKPGRAALRQACAPRNADDGGLAAGIAHRLLEDGTLFVRAVGLTYTTAAQNRP